LVWEKPVKVIITCVGNWFELKYIEAFTYCVGSTSAAARRRRILNSDAHTKHGDASDDDDDNNNNGCVR
jgi:hypothetical protein